MCLVHENQDCIVDLIRNLKYLDPQSTILLYNGGTRTDLLTSFPFEKYGVVIHPNPKPLKWGWLHDFAIDCMEYAINNLEFDTITVVDSDQLACGRNYSDYITETFYKHPNLGMLGQVATKIDSTTTIDPAITAYQEKALWQPFLDQLPNGKDAFLYWTFWPSTVFTYTASVALVKLFRTNKALHEILKETKIWASEEIILPTLTVALGFSIVENPCNYDYVQYKTFYEAKDIQDALEHKETFWIHPVSRAIRDKNRNTVKTHFNNYIEEYSKQVLEFVETLRPKIAMIEGWLYDEEVELLTSLAFQKAKNVKNAVFVEIGSYCGKATAVLASVTKHVNNQSKIFAIDDFTGKLGAEDVMIRQYGPSYEKFKANLEQLQVLDQVEIIKGTSHLIDFDDKIDFILIDGLHDYANVARDFFHFEKNFKEDTTILFHDYCIGYPGVMSFVKELIHKGIYSVVKHTNSLIALQKKQRLAFEDNDKRELSNIEYQIEEYPLVSCIMPTYNRAEFIENAIDQFLNQSYPNKELIIIDDSEVAIEHLIPDHPLIKYVYLHNKLDIGSKRNMACKMSNGQYIIHLDDDDYYAPQWVEKQIAFLRANELEVTGLNRPLFYEKYTSKLWKYNYPDNHKPWVYGATLCYTKELWKSNPFPKLHCGEDNAFVWADSIKKIQVNTIKDGYIGQIHDKNTSPKMTNDARWEIVEAGDILDEVLRRLTSSPPIPENVEK